MADNLLEYLREFLVTEDVVRKPAVAGLKPPMFLEPRDGAPTPGSKVGAENDDAIMVSAFITGGIPPRPYESFMRRQAVDISIRARTAPLAYQLDAQIREALIDKRGWDMAGLFVLESVQSRELQRIGSDSTGYFFTVTYVFETYAAAVPNLS